MTKSKKATLISTSVLLVVSVFAATFFYLLNSTADNTKPTQPQTSVSQTEVSTQPQQNVSKTADDISAMTLEEKVAQMIMVSCHQNVDIEKACQSGVGGICLYTYSFENKSKEQVVSMIKGYQELADVPMLVSVDEEGGTVVRVSANPALRQEPFLSPSEVYQQGGYDAVTDDTNEKADLLLSLGINVNLAPVCDVPLDSSNYIYDRCFSLNHDEVSQYTQTVVTAMDNKGIGSCLKHFPGYGGSIDTHQSMSYDDREFEKFVEGDFKPFEAGINAGADSVLVSHNIVGCMDEKMPASLSLTVHEVLRNDLKFDGVVITDDLVMEGITQFTDGENAAVLAVKAGNDMIICNDFDGAISAIVSAVKSGDIEESQIDESVRRIYDWKKKLSII